MAAITLDQITNSSNSDNGTGIFDKLMQAAEQHIQQEYSADRITGTDYATVYLGAVQAVLAQSVQFALGVQQADKQADLIQAQIDSEVKKNETNGLIDLEKKRLQEQIDLVIAQTAAQYETIDASKQGTKRENLLNSKQVIKLDKDTELVVRQESELAANGIQDRLLKVEQTQATKAGALDKTNQTNAQVALFNAQEDKTESDTLHERFLAIAKLQKENGYDVTFGLDGAIGSITPGTDGLVDAKIEETNNRISLVDQQKIGLRTDAKQKALKLMLDAYSVNANTLGETGSQPSGSTGSRIDAVLNDIFDDWGSSVNF